VQVTLFAADLADGELLHAAAVIARTPAVSSPADSRTPVLMT
jgi:hypothetical protein